MKDVKTFFEKLSKDEKLRLEVSEALKSLGKAEKENEEVVFKKIIAPSAQKHGFNFTYQDYINYKETFEKNGQGLPESLLEKTSGGFDFNMETANGIKTPEKNICASIWLGDNNSHNCSRPGAHGPHACPWGVADPYPCPRGIAK